MEVHTETTIVPMLRGAAYDALKKDIQDNGQQVPIALWKGKVIDGRNRLRACRELGIRPICSELQHLPQDSRVLYVLSTNLYRRHLNPSQLAMVGARARKYFDEEARARKSSRHRHARQSSEAGDARDLAGMAVGVSGRSIDYATKVLTHGVPDLIAACDEGALAVSTAAKLAELSAAKQRSLLRDGKQAIVQAVRAQAPDGRPPVPRDPLKTLLKQARAILRAMNDCDPTTLTIDERVTGESCAREIARAGSSLLEYVDSVRKATAAEAAADTGGSLALDPYVANQGEPPVVLKSL